MTPHDPVTPIHDEYRCAAVAAIAAGNLALSAHGVPSTPVHVGAALLKALAILSARGNVRFMSNN